MDALKFFELGVAGANLIWNTQEIYDSSERESMHKKAYAIACIGFSIIALLGTSLMLLKTAKVFIRPDRPGSITIKGRLLPIELNWASPITVFAKTRTIFTVASLISNIVTPFILYVKGDNTKIRPELFLMRSIVDITIFDHQRRSFGRVVIPGIPLLSDLILLLSKNDF